MISVCFPQGINNETNQYLCSSDDYGNVIKIFNSFTNNVIYANISVFNITENDLKG